MHELRGKNYKFCQNKQNTTTEIISSNSSLQLIHPIQNVQF